MLYKAKSVTYTIRVTLADNPTTVSYKYNLEVVCYYLLFCLLYINIEIGKNRC